MSNDRLTVRPGSCDIKTIKYIIVLYTQGKNKTRNLSYLLFSIEKCTLRLNVNFICIFSKFQQNYTYLNCICKFDSHHTAWFKNVSCVVV